MKHRLKEDGRFVPDHEASPDHPASEKLHDSGAHLGDRTAPVPHKDHEQGGGAGGECGSCLGLEIPGECCNSCEDVKRVAEKQNLPAMAALFSWQCQSEKKGKNIKESHDKNEGCMITGYFDVKKVSAATSPTIPSSPSVCPVCPVLSHETPHKR